jgi:hypothetical protein
MTDPFENLEGMVDNDKSKEFISRVDEHIKTLEEQRRKDGEMIASLKKARRKYGPPSATSLLLRNSAIILAAMYAGMSYHAGLPIGYHTVKPVVKRIVYGKEIVRYSPKDSDPIRHILYKVTDGDTADSISQRLYGTPECMHHVREAIDRRSKGSSFLYIPDACKRKA